MKKSLIFLESATKKKTIQTFLGPEYVIFATSGHLRELKKAGVYNLGVDLNKFTPTYEIIPEKQKFITFWKDYLAKENIANIYLATDPDREGEAIAKEVVELLNLNNSQFRRLLFYEITPHSVKEALNSPSSLNENLVQAQLSRQVLDRMIGFCLSPLLQKIQKIQTLSAGRVQSVVLKLIIIREELVKKYEKKKDYIICGISQIKEQKITLKQVSKEGDLVVYLEKAEAEKIKKELSLNFKLVAKKEEKKMVLPQPPLITSSLLSEAKSQLGFSVAQTTQLAQKLYEGIFIKSQGKPVGLITYPRTDSIRVNRDFVSQARRYIQEKWGFDYYNSRPAWEKLEKKSNVQDAHEAIHPTYLNYQPEIIKNSLTNEEYQLYQMIFNHTLASLMNPAQINKISYTFYNEKENLTELNPLSKDYFSRYFATTERVCQFMGFLISSPAVYLSRYNIKLTSALNTVLQLKAKKIEVQEYVENKPVRYNEGSMVQELERLGIGRPSTYNLFGRVLLKRGYVELNKKGHFVPAPLGISVNQWLQENFASLINEKYTASLETELDKISHGENNYQGFIKNFWEEFYRSLQKKILLR